MADLYPTPTRLTLVRDVAAGNVYRDRHDQDWLVYGEPIADKVTWRIAEAKGAGWVQLTAKRVRDWAGQWQLTDAGRAVLDAHGGA